LALIAYDLLTCRMSRPATPELSPLSLHDALPISGGGFIVIYSNLADGEVDSASLRMARSADGASIGESSPVSFVAGAEGFPAMRSEEHTSELQSRENLVCRLLLEKKINREVR